jgi:hypothetical protein
LKRLFSRGDFTDAYLTGKIKEPMTGMRTEDDKKVSSESSEIKPEIIKTRVSAKAQIKLGAPSSLTLYCEERSITVYGEVPSPALNAPLTDESVKARLCKMGNTFLSLSPDDIELDLDEGINLSPSALNALRREACVQPFL